MGLMKKLSISAIFVVAVMCVALYVISNSIIGALWRSGYNERDIDDSRKEIVESFNYYSPDRKEKCSTLGYLEESNRSSWHPEFVGGFTKIRTNVFAWDLENLKKEYNIYFPIGAEKSRWSQIYRDEIESYAPRDFPTDGRHSMPQHIVGVTRVQCSWGGGAVYEYNIFIIRDHDDDPGVFYLLRIQRGPLHDVPEPSQQAGVAPNYSLKADVPVGPHP